MKPKHGRAFSQIMPQDQGVDSNLFLWKTSPDLARERWSLVHWGGWSVAFEK